MNRFNIKIFSILGIISVLILVLSFGFLLIIGVSPKYHGNIIKIVFSISTIIGMLSLILCILFFIRFQFSKIKYEGYNVLILSVFLEFAIYNLSTWISLIKLGTEFFNIKINNKYLENILFYLPIIISTFLIMPSCFILSIVWNLPYSEKKQRKLEMIEGLRNQNEENTPEMKYIEADNNKDVLINEDNISPGNSENNNRIII